jgi:O-antigen biosynthesis protein
LVRIINQAFSSEVSQQTLKELDKYGFFKGTMFWARFDALRPILKRGFGYDDFEPETGQIDGTLAHGLERALCLVPEILGRQICEVGKKNVRPISYATTEVPEWSDFYITKNQKRKR